MLPDNLLIVVLLLVLAALFDAVQDKLQHHYYDSIFNGFGKWWNPAESWALKWKNGDPLQGEKFLFSSTVFAWTTDAWHFFQMLSLSSWQLALAILLVDGWLNVLIWFVILKTLFSGFFEFTFRIALQKRKNS